MLKRLSIMLMLMAIAALGRAQTLQGYEYWIDNDYTAHQSVSTTSPDVNLQLPTGQMGQGVHFFNFRAQAVDGEWGPLSRHLFFVPEGIGEGVTVTKMQYWIDSDHSSAQTIDVSSVDIAHFIDVSQLSEGVHYLGLRLQNSEGEWNAPTRHFFFVPDVMGIPSVTKMEYWYDNDQKNRKTVDLSSETVIESLDVSLLEEGVHYLNIRLQNSEGAWSTPSRHFFFNPGSDYGVNSPLVGYEYNFNGESKYVSIPEQTEYVIDGMAIDLPDPLISGSLEDGCTYTFTATEAHLKRTTPMNFSIAFENKTHNWSNRVGESFSVVDELTHALTPMALRQSATVEKVSAGDFTAVSIDISQSRSYYMHATQPCRVQLFRPNGSLLTTLDMSDEKKSYQIVLESGTYHAVVYKTTQNEQYPATNLTLRIQENEEFVPEPVIDYENEILTLSCPMTEATILYSLDGTEPQTVYTVPITLKRNAEVRARAIRTGYDSSELVSLTIDSYKVEMPVITFTNLHVYIDCDTEESTIHYTLNGSAPLVNGQIYKDPIAITANCTVKAIATRENYHNSDVATKEIDVTNLTTSSPKITRDGNKLIVTSLTEGAVFHYTTDGSTPTAESPSTERIILPEHNCTVRVVAMKEGEIPSAIVDFNVDWMQAEKPLFSYDEGTSMLTISCGTPGSVIYYTTDGTDPTRHSTVYKQPLHIDGNLTVKAFAVAENFNDSEVGTYSTSSFTCAQPTIRLENEALVMTCRTSGAEIYYTLDGSSPEKGTLYSEPVSVSEPCLIRAISMKENYNSSSVAEFLLQRTTTPTFQRSGNTVTVTTLTEDAAIHYTLDGTVPTAQSALVPEDGRLTLEHNLMLKAIALKDQELASSIGELSVDWFQAEKPLFSYDEGTSMLTISCGTPGSVIYYEIGDTEPTRNSAVYHEPLTLVDNRMVRALAVAENFNDSEIGEYCPDYFTCEPPVLAYDGRHLTMSCATEGVTIYYTLDGSMPSNKSEEYTHPLEMKQLLTIRAVALKPNTNNSTVSVYNVDYYYDGAKAETATEGVLSKAFQWSGTAGIEQLTLAGAINDADMEWLCSNISDLRHLDMSGARFANNELTAQTFSGLRVPTLNVPQSVTKAAAGTFSNCPCLAAIIWNPSFRLSKEILGELTNPNLLLYIKTRGYGPAEGVNVVVDNHADIITLSDAEGNNNFYCPQPFLADYISYTHSYSMKTGLGSNHCSGWETIALPFDVQQVTHPLNGVVAPFIANRQNGEKPFWLCTLETGGFESTSSLAANTPYIIAMPNNPSYADEFLLAGNVTFEAVNATVKVSNELQTGKRGNMTLMPNFFERSKTTGMLVLNIGEEFEGYVPGSAFFSDLDRNVHPFQAYVVEESAASRILPISEEVTGIKDLELQVAGKDVFVDLLGRKISTRRSALGKGVYIYDGRKILKK